VNVSRQAGLLATWIVLALSGFVSAPLAAQTPSAAEEEARPDIGADPAVPPGPAVPSDPAGSTGAASGPASSDASGDSHPTLSVGGWRITWDDGLRYELRQLVPFVRPSEWLPSPRVEGRPRVRGKIGLKLQVDGALYNAGSGMPSVDDGAEVRRARLFTEGEFFLVRPIDYRLEFGIANESVYLNDFYLGLHDLPVVGTLRVGQMKPPFSLDRLTSSLDTTFMERASPVDAFAPGYLAGVLVQNHGLDGRLTGAIGWFSDGTGDDSGDASESLSRVVGRVTWLPQDDESSGVRRLVHLGLSGSYVFSPSETIRYRSRPESHLAPYLVDTGDIDAQSSGLIGLEAAVVHGPFTLQGEGIVALVDPQSGRGQAFWGVNVFGSWFLTGESRPYDRQTGVFTAVVPRKPFSFQTWGPGAWELKLRWSYTDLDDGPVHGGRMGILSAGVNWYLDGHWRMTVEYLFTHTDGPSGDGTLHILQSRLQLRF
jgi:phosphate-selective porin OprO/OprP